MRRVRFFRLAVTPPSAGTGAMYCSMVTFARRDHAEHGDQVHEHGGSRAADAVTSDGMREERDAEPGKDDAGPGRRRRASFRQSHAGGEQRGRKESQTGPRLYGGNDRGVWLKDSRRTQMAYRAAKSIPQFCGKLPNSGYAR